MEKQTFESAFAEAVPESFGFLLERGFQMHKEQEFLFHFDSPRVRVGVDLEPRSVGLWIGPHPSTLKPATPAHALSVTWFAELHGAPHERGLGTFRSPDEIRGTLQKLADLLRQHCSSILEGDFREFPAAEALAAKVLQQENSWMK